MVITVPVTFGSEIVLSAVGSTTVNVVSYASADAPSKIRVMPALSSTLPLAISFPLVVTSPVTLIPVDVVASFWLLS